VLIEVSKIRGYELKDMKILILCSLFIVKLSAAQVPVPGAQDHYRDFSSLIKDNVEGVDYSIHTKRTNSNILVMAFHGGFIESGTTELAEEIAGDDFNFYTFKGIKPIEIDERTFTSSALHLTSTRFDDPKLIGMTSDAEECLGVHGFGGEEADFCVGGGNLLLRQVMVQVLKTNFPEYVSCELCCNPYNGLAKLNPVNRCKLKGIQVELSPQIRKRILRDNVFRKSLANNFREVLNKGIFIDAL